MYKINIMHSTEKGITITDYFLILILHNVFNTLILQHNIHITSNSRHFSLTNQKTDFFYIKWMYSSRPDMIIFQKKKRILIYLLYNSIQFTLITLIIFWWWWMMIIHKFDWKISESFILIAILIYLNSFIIFIRTL